MSAISTAIGSERISRTSGYKLRKGFFDNTPPNLGQQIVILAEANTANQGTIALNGAGAPIPVEITSADQAGRAFGYGSPIHQIARILRPISGDGVGGIPTIVMAQLAAGGATATVIVWTVTGTATKNATHEIIINGRDTLDFVPYSVSIATGDTPTAVALKYANAINAVLGTPFIATVNLGVLTLTTKWKGLTSAQAFSSININGDAAGLTYALTSTTAGAGAADISGALLQFGDNWYTTVINSYGTATLATLEQFNGIPDDLNPTGRYQGQIFKPFMAFFGSTISVAADLITITDATARVDQVTNVLCPAPGSSAFPWEAAANMATLFCRIMQDTPHLDVAGKSYPDMPTPLIGVIGDMSDYNTRDQLVKNGCSTVLLANGAYQVQDLVTTYHPDGEVPLQYNWARNLNLDWNVKDGYTILEIQSVRDHVLIQDTQVVDVIKAIKPKEWKAVLFAYFDYLGTIGLINNPAFSKASLNVQIDTNNPNRFNTFFRYKRTGIARIESTDVEAGF